MDSKQRILTIIKEHIDENVDEMEFQEIMEYINDTVYYLKQGETTFEKELGKMLQDKIDEIVKDNDLCPDCFSRTEYKIIHSATYDYPCEGITKCTNCEWYQ